MFNALKDHAGTVELISSRHGLLAKSVTKANYYLGKYFKSKFGLSQNLIVSRLFGWQYGRYVDPQKHDVIFAPLGSNEVAYLKTPVPIVYMSDATFKALENYYFTADSVSDLHRRQGTQLETLTLKKSAAIIYPSIWAAASAQNDYGADPSRVHVIPLGANIDDLPSRDSLLTGSSDGKCRLLFVGREWQRKGGQIALDAFLALRERGVNVQLTIVGCEPPQAVNDTNLIVIPLINKRVEAERKKLEELYYTSDFFLLPTRAECFGMVFCEANAYGLPIVSTATGGVSTIVQDGVNGFLLPHEAGGKQYADVIERVWADQEAYKALRISTRDRYDQALNWKSWAESVRGVMESVVSRKAS